MEIQLEQLALFQSDEMLFSSVKSEGRVCISKEREVFIRKLMSVSVHLRGAGIYNVYLSFSKSN